MTTLTTKGPTTMAKTPGKIKRYDWHVTVNGDYLSNGAFAFYRTVDEVLSSAGRYAANGEVIRISGGSLKNERAYVKGAMGFTQVKS